MIVLLQLHDWRVTGELDEFCRGTTMRASQVLAEVRTLNHLEGVGRLLLGLHRRRQEMAGVWFTRKPGLNGLCKRSESLLNFWVPVLKQHCYQGPQQIGTWQVLNSKEESGSLCCGQQDWSERLIINCMFSFLYYSLDGYLSFCIILNKLFLYKLIIFITVFDVLVHGFYTG